MEREHNYPKEVVDKGEKYLDYNKISLVKWGVLEEFVLKNLHIDSYLTGKVKKYCTWRALTNGILTYHSDKNFTLINGLNPDLEGVSLYFRKLEAIQEYKKETNQEDNKIAMVID